MLQLSRLLGKAMIGKVPNEITDGEIQAHLDPIPLPVKNACQNRTALAG